MTPNLAWHTGLVAGSLLKAGAQVLPTVDDDGSYTNEMKVGFGLSGGRFGEAQFFLVTITEDD